MLVLEPDGVWTPQGLKTGHVVEIEDGWIIGVVPAPRHPVSHPLPGRILLPGLVNAHSHAFQRAFRGHVQWRSAEHDDFWSWRDAMYAVASRLDPEGVEAVSALAFLEMAEAGVTRVGEFHYLHHQPDGTRYADPDELARRVIAAAMSVGIRIALLRVAYARGGPGVPLRPDQARFGDADPDDVLAALQRLDGATADPRITLGLAPHSVRALDADWLRALSAFDGPVHAHVSEQPAENEAAIAEHGASPLAVLADAGLVRGGFTAVHLTWPLAGDLELLQAAAGSVCVCPSTELDLGDGFLPVEARLRLPLCLGSDSHARIDLFAEARDLELHARGLAGRRNVLTPPGQRHGLAHRLLQAATVAGDRALGGAGQGIAAGAPADLVAVDLRRTAAWGVPPLEAIAFTATPEWVDTVWVAGEPIVSGGYHPKAEAIRARARPWLG
ncbi:MAG TPA: formimidoylglutamate deiminase [Deltaproteobacteria bacterium]|nr:formimidoylglutamate deiminase [Deltaproteobacteria bacterium]